MTRFRQIERALEIRHAVTNALSDWDALGFDALLGSLGEALGAQSVTAWAARQSRLSPVATWLAADAEPSPLARVASDVVVRARSTGVPVSGPAARPDGAPGPRGVRQQVAFPVLTVTGVLAVIDVQSRIGFEVSETLAHLLGGVGRELGAFFSCRAASLDLSAREREVLELIAEGLSASEIAMQLVVSPATVRRHIENAYGKLGVNDRVSAVVKAMRAGLIE